MDFSVYDREMGGYPLTAHQFEAGLPSAFKMVAIPPGEQPRSIALQNMLQRYERIADLELPEWTVYKLR